MAPVAEHDAGSQSGVCDDGLMSGTRIALIGDYSPSVTAHRHPACLGTGCQGSQRRRPAGVDPHVEAGRRGRNALPALLPRNLVRACVALRQYGRRNLRNLSSPHGRNPVSGNPRRVPTRFARVFRNVIGTADVAHAELNPEATRPVISKLSCSQVEVIRNDPTDSRLAEPETVWNR